MSQKSKEGPIRSLDLEKWRVKYGLTSNAACELLGLQRLKWLEMKNNPTAEVEDKAVCILVSLYEAYPDTMPIKRIVDVPQEMRGLDLNPDDPKDKRRFAGMVGRENAAVYGWIRRARNVSKPVERLLEALHRLPAESARKKRQILESIVMEVAEGAGVRDPLSRGAWRRES